MRIGLSLLLLCSLHNPLSFTSLYILCGLSDLLDGYIARVTSTQSELGAKLDSLADLFFFSIVMVMVSISLGSSVRPFLPWILAILLIRCVNLVVAAHKYKCFAILHTYGNKITGWVLYTSPIFLFYGHTVIFWAVCAVALFSAIEEFAIHISSQMLNLNRRSLFLSE